jgi:hypothetical protein
MASESPYRSTALRYALNDHEQVLLHHYLVQRLRRHSPSRRTIAEARCERNLAHDDFRAATVRSSLRVFLGTAAGLKAWELVAATIGGRGTSQR